MAFCHRFARAVKAHQQRVHLAVQQHPVRLGLCFVESEFFNRHGLKSEVHEKKAEILLGVSPGGSL